MSAGRTEFIALKEFKSELLGSFLAFADTAHREGGAQHGGDHFSRCSAYFCLRAVEVLEEHSRLAEQFGWAGWQDEEAMEDELPPGNRNE